MSEVSLECREKSLDLLNSLTTPHGFIASSENRHNYYRVWSRDGVITGLAGLLSDQEDLLKAFQKTLETLRSFQDETGRIPSNVSLDQKKVSYGTNVGRVDATLWYIIGYTELVLRGKINLDKDLERSLKKAVFYLSCLELNGKGLLYIPEGGDWADEYINHGYVLYDQLLYYVALKNNALVFKEESTNQKAENLKRVIETNYFPKPDSDENYIFNQALYNKYFPLYSYPAPLVFFNASTFNFRIDTLAISIIILLEFLDEKHRKDLIELIRKIAGPNSVSPAFHPVINENDPDWHRLKNNYLFEFRNKPYEYHNGGLWPLVHGFYLSGTEDKELLKQFALALKKENYIFPEFFHGKTGKGLGVQNSAFTASSYLIAYEGVINNNKLFKYDFNR